MKVAIFGKKSTNGWGLEGLIERNLFRARNGHTVHLFDTDAFNRGASAFWDYTHLVFIQGRGCDRQQMRRHPGKKVLWNAEFLPYAGKENQPDAIARLQAIEPLEDFDLILNGCPRSAAWLRDARGVYAEWFPMMGVDASKHVKLKGVEKKHTVGFYGAVSERRVKILDQIGRDLRPYNIAPQWPGAFGDDLIYFINQCQIVVNVHYVDILNTESRIYEVLGCGTFCVSEPLSHPALFAPYIEVCEPEQMGATILRLLGRGDDHIEQTASAGQRYVHERLSMPTVLQKLFVFLKGVS